MKRFRMEPSIQLQFFHHSEHKFWIYYFAFAWSLQQLLCEISKENERQTEDATYILQTKELHLQQVFWILPKTESAEARDQRCFLLRMNIHINSHFPFFLSDISNQSLTKSWRSFLHLASRNTWIISQDSHALLVLNSKGVPFSTSASDTGLKYFLQFSQQLRISCTVLETSANTLLNMDQHLPKHEHISTVCLLPSFLLHTCTLK